MPKLNEVKYAAMALNETDKLALLNFLQEQVGEPDGDVHTESGPTSPPPPPPKPKKPGDPG